MLEASDISVAFSDRGGGHIIALEVTAFAPAPGALTALRGGSGSGKSTLLLVLAGIQPPARGAVRFTGTDIYALVEAARDEWRRRNVGFVFQDFHLIPELSPLVNVILPATFGRADPGIRARGAALLERLRVPHRSGGVEALSRGEQQRVALARALLFDPPLLLADEPTASLDDTAAAEVVAILRDCAKAGRTVVVASHDAALLAAADATLALDHGRVAGPRRVAA